MTIADVYEDEQAGRIQTILDSLREHISTLDDAALGRLEEAAQLDMSDRCVIQERVSLAQANGNLSYPSAMLLYGIFRDWATADLPERILYVECAGIILGAAV